MNMAFINTFSLGHKDTKNNSKIGKMCLNFIICGEILMIMPSI